MCNYKSAVKFLDAIICRHDDAFVIGTYLNSPENVLAADIYCHSTCCMSYVHLSKQSETSCGPAQINHKVHGSFVLFLYNNVSIIALDDVDVVIR